jgi:hypothetical protein
MRDLSSRGCLSEKTAEEENPLFFPIGWWVALVAAMSIHRPRNLFLAELPFVFANFFLESGDGFAITL